MSIAEQRAVGFIPAWSLAFLHTRVRMAYKGGGSIILSMQKVWKAEISCEGEQRYHDLAKWLSHYLIFLFLFFSFLLLLR